MDRRDYDKELGATLDAITVKRPVYKELVDRFGELFQVQAKLADDFMDLDAEAPHPSPQRLGQGVSMLADAGLPPVPEMFRLARERILPLLKMHFPFNDEVASLKQAAEGNEADLNALARAYLENDQNTLDAEAKRLDVRTAVLAFALRCLLVPVLSSLVRRVEADLDNAQWSQGYCPFCGSAPAIASLSKINNDRDENLVGGGGKKYLTCALCSRQWAFRRDACPACGNTDHDTRELIFAEDAKHERIEACKKCGTYMLCVDLREVDGDPRLEALPLGLVHLDLIAKGKNYSPLAILPWNMA